MNTQKDRKQGRDENSEKSKQQQSNGPQFGSGKGKKQGTPEKENQEQLTNKSEGKPWKPKDKPEPSVEGEEDTEDTKNPKKEKPYGQRKDEQLEVQEEN